MEKRKKSKERKERETKYDKNKVEILLIRILM